MAGAPHILARTFAEAHTFARDTLGLNPGYYRVVNSVGTLKSVRGVDLYLVPGWKNRFDRFAMSNAIRWTRMNIIDVAEQIQASAPEAEMRAITEDEATAFILDWDQEGDPLEDLQNAKEAMISEGGPVAILERVAAIDPKQRRRRRCSECGTLHFKNDPCPTES